MKFKNNKFRTGGFSLHFSFVYIQTHNNTWLNVHVLFNLFLHFILLHLCCFFSDSEIC